MDLRRELRLLTGGRAAVTLLGEAESMDAEIVNLSARGICVAVNRSVCPGAPLQIDFSDTLLLGEAVYCRPAGDGFQVGVALEHALCHVAEWARIRRRLLGGLPKEESAGYESGRDLTPL